jgi:hypothetical protein
MAGLVPAIHVFSLAPPFKTWMPATSAGMTRNKHHPTYSTLPEPAERMIASVAATPWIACSSVTG